MTLVEVGTVSGYINVDGATVAVNGTGLSATSSGGKYSISNVSDRQ